MLHSRSNTLALWGLLFLAVLLTALIGGPRGQAHDAARPLAAGDVDLSFAPSAGLLGTVEALALQPDGKLLVGGSFISVNGAARNSLVRLNSDGSLDNSFNLGTGINLVTGGNGTVNMLAFQPDGKILVGGSFAQVNGTARTNLARLNSDGSLDTTFTTGTGPNASVLAAAFQPDGKILVGGAFNAYNGATASRIARLHPDGSLDPTFNTGTGASGSVNTLARQTDGSLVLGGTFTAFNGATRNRLARINMDGSLDPGFNAGAGITGSNVNSCALLDDGKLLIGGLFTAVNGVPRRNLARLNPDGTPDTAFDADTHPGQRPNSL